MNLLPKASGTRPRVACDISAQGVVAARSDDAESPLAATSRVELLAGAVVPSLKPGNVVDRVAVVAALRKVLEDVGMKPNSRDADVSLVVPDSAVRVSVLEFDSLPAKLTEALPLVRFRLKKMLPFDADDAMVTFQAMSTSKTLTRVLAVAIPRDVLREYEGAVREAGYEPGAVIPSTLAALAAIDEDPALVVNANELGVTAAIVRGGILMLHRSVDLQMEAMGVPANLPPALFEESPATNEFAMLPLVDVHESAGEWAAQEALPEHGRNPYADRLADEAAVQNIDGITGMPVVHVLNGGSSGNDAGLRHEPGDVRDSPYASPTLTADLSAELHNAILIAPTSIGTLTEEGGGGEMAAAALHVAPPVERHAAIALQEEIAQAVSVAVAYFEDTLAVMPDTILSAGPLGAAELNRMLQAHGMAQEDGIGVRELVRSDAITADAAGVPRGWLSGVRGALRG
jgi:type IV pilus assembly protein PilM